MSDKTTFCSIPHNRTNAITFSAQIASLVNSSEARQASCTTTLVEAYTGVKNSVVLTMVKRKFPPAFSRQIVLGNSHHLAWPGYHWQDRRYRMIDFLGYFLDPLYLTLDSACRAGAYPDGLPPGIEPILDKGVRHVVDHFEKGKIAEDEMQPSSTFS